MKLNRSLVACCLMATTLLALVPARISPARAEVIAPTMAQTPPAAAGAVQTTAAAGSVVYRAVNVNGGAVSVGGVSYESGLTAPDFSGGPFSFCDRGVGLVPVGDVGLGELVRCSSWGRGAPGARLTMSGVPNGGYEVSLVVWEDNFSQVFDVLVNGVVRAAKVVSGAPGSWRELGPFPVTVTNGIISVTTAGGDANLSALVVRRPATVTPAAGASATITGPAEGATVSRPTTITGTASSTSGVAHVHLEIVDTANGNYWNGSGWQTGQTEVAPSLAQPGGTTTTWSYAFTPPSSSASPYRLTVTAHGGAGAAEGVPSTGTFHLAGAPAAATFDPTKVVDELVAGGNWDKALAADFLPDSHLLVLTQPGLVYDVNPATGSQHLAVDLRSLVFSKGESGALDLLIDQAGTGFYVYYTAAGSDRLRISHVELATGAVEVIWNNPGLGYNANNPYHAGGSLNWGLDGKLYLGIGDRVEGRSQDLSNVWGKILRINPDGTVPEDNPFVGRVGAVGEIWAYGLRNPYRATIDPDTGNYWAGDVGGNVDAQAYEEVDLIEGGRNYGWPTCEGPVAQPKNGPVCPTGVVGPVHSYPHDPTPQPSLYFNRAIVGGEIYRGAKFPLYGAYLFADYPTNRFHWLRLGTDGRTAGDSGVLATVSGRTPVWLGAGPDGAVYWVGFGYGNSQLRRLRYTGSVNQPPLISTAIASPASGPAPLAVHFTGTAIDPEGAALSYQWDFGDGTTSDEAEPSHVYPEAGHYQARLRVTAGAHTVSSDLVLVEVGSAPEATITAPADGTSFDAGEEITVTGTGVDPDELTLGEVTLSWNVLFLHNDHSHPVTTGTGSTVSFVVPATGHDFTGDTRYQVELTATGSSGLRSTARTILHPNKVPVPLASAVATTVTVDGITHNLPFTIDSVTGFHHTVAVPDTVCVDGLQWAFTGWSDGGTTASHAIVVGPVASPEAIFEARYAAGEVSCSPAGTLRVSTSADRSAPVILAGSTQTAGRGIYVFLDTVDQNYTKVEFWLDNPAMTGSPRQLERVWPYDFAGGGTATANPFTASGLAPGSHTISARVTRPDGSTEATTASFTVG